MILRRWLLAVTATLACGFAVAACGGSARHPLSRQAREVAVVKAWSTALRRGDIAGAASYFALPSVFVNGVALRVRTAGEARTANSTLSCGARYLSARSRGRYLEVVFVLTGRSGPGGTSCMPGKGEKAGVAFLFTNDKISAWLRLSSVTAPGPAVPTPSTPTTPAPSSPSPGPETVPGGSSPTV